MDESEFKALQVTFPWTRRAIQTKTGAVIQVLDNQGQEVPLLKMVDFLEMITKRLTPKPKQEEAKTTEEQKQ